MGRCALSGVAHKHQLLSETLVAFVVPSRCKQAAGMFGHVAVAQVASFPAVDVVTRTTRMTPPVSLLEATEAESEEDDASASAALAEANAAAEIRAGMSSFFMADEREGAPEVPAPPFASAKNPV